jgi:hypothetical protein
MSRRKNFIDLLGYIETARTVPCVRCYMGMARRSFYFRRISEHQLTALYAFGLERLILLTKEVKQ